MDTPLASHLAGPLAQLRGQLKSRAGDDKPPPTDLTDWSEPEQIMVREVQAALGVWRASSAGRAFAASVRGRDRDGLRRDLEALMASPILAPTRQLLEHARAQALPFSISAISLGVAAQAELGVGLYGSVGVVTDLLGHNGRSAFYMLAGAAEGPDAGVDGAIQAGLWRQAVTDIGGFYYGVGLSVADVVGAGVYGLRTHRSDMAISTVLIDIDAGVNDGVSGLELYAMTLDPRRIGASSNDKAG